MNLPAWITVEPCDHSGLHWQIVDAWWEDNTAGVNTYGYLFDLDGLPTLAHNAMQHNGGDTQLHPEIKDLKAEVSFPMTGDSSFDPNKGEVGPYALWMLDYPSDKISGMGLPLRRHVQYYVSFKLMTGGNVIVPVPPTPSAEIAYLQSRIARAFHAAAEDLAKPI